MHDECWFQAYALECATLVFICYLVFSCVSLSCYLFLLRRLHSIEIRSLCIFFVLTSLNPELFQLQVGKNFASEVVATILIGLHMSETSWPFSFNKQTKRHVVNPITRGDCICPTHNLFGIKSDVQMSCRCGNCSDDDEYVYTTRFHKLDAGSRQTTKVCFMQYISCLVNLV
jgi:hypothetical protein